MPASGQHQSTSSCEETMRSRISGALKEKLTRGSWSARRRDVGGPNGATCSAVKGSDGAAHVDPGSSSGDVASAPSKTSARSEEEAISVHDDSVSGRSTTTSSVLQGWWSSLVGSETWKNPLVVPAAREDKSSSPTASTTSSFFLSKNGELRWWYDAITSGTTGLRARVEERVEEMYGRELAQVRFFFSVFEKELSRSEQARRTFQEIKLHTRSASGAPAPPESTSTSSARKSSDPVVSSGHEKNAREDTKKRTGQIASNASSSDEALSTAKSRPGSPDKEDADGSDAAKTSSSAVDIQPLMNLAMLTAAERYLATSAAKRGSQKTSREDVKDLEFLERAARYMKCAHLTYKLSPTEMNANGDEMNKSQLEGGTSVEGNGKSQAQEDTISMTTQNLAAIIPPEDDEPGGGHTSLTSATVPTFDRVLFSRREKDDSQIGQKKFARPQIVVGTDESRSAIVVAIRGTATLDDVMTDLMVDTRTVFVPDLQNSALTFHEGMFNSAVYVLEEAHATVERELGDHGAAGAQNLDRYNRVVFCGHSLGGGVAQIAALLLSQLRRGVESWNDVQIECWSFAGPPVARKMAIDHGTGTSQADAFVPETLDEVFAGSSILDNYKSDKSSARRTDDSKNYRNYGRTADCEDASSSTTPPSGNVIDFSAIKNLESYPFVMEHDLVAFLSVGSIMRLLLTLQRIEALQWTFLEKIQFILQAECSSRLEEDAMLMRLSDAVDDARRLQAMWRNGTSAGGSHEDGEAENHDSRAKGSSPAEARSAAPPGHQERLYNPASLVAPPPEKSQLFVRTQSSDDYMESTARQLAQTSISVRHDAMQHLAAGRGGKYFYYICESGTVQEVGDVPLGFEPIPVGWRYHVEQAEVGLQTVRQHLDSHRAKTYENALREAAGRLRTRQAIDRLEEGGTVGSCPETTSSCRVENETKVVDGRDEGRGDEQVLAEKRKTVPTHHLGG
ncbi:unnamed protein product [Amoebophrya sp. A120]|nr:unnamed protein product [Amoebophrya sp. A120]|eukprot:GSA120T00024905001.1